MARKKAATAQRSGGVVVVQTPQAPVQRRRSSGTRAVTSGRKRRSSRRSSVGGSDGNMNNRMMGQAIGGFGVGFIEKQFGDKIPSFPIVGRKGAIAAAVYFFKPKNPILRDIGLAAAALAGYQFAKEGRVDGDDDDDVSGDMLTT